MWVLVTLAQIQKRGQTKSGSDRQREVLQLSTNPNNLQEWEYSETKIMPKEDKGVLTKISLTEIIAKVLEYRFEHCRIPKHTISQKSTWASHEPTPQIADTIMDMIKQR